MQSCYGLKETDDIVQNGFELLKQQKTGYRRNHWIEWIPFEAYGEITPNQFEDLYSRGIKFEEIHVDGVTLYFKVQKYPDYIIDASDFVEGLPQLANGSEYDIKEENTDNGINIFVTIYDRDCMRRITAQFRDHPNSDYRRTLSIVLEPYRPRKKFLIDGSY